MLSKAELLASLARETSLTKHLVTKLDAGHLDHRLSAAQRSLGELLDYLAVQQAGSVAYFLTGSWDRWEALEKQVKNLQPSAFAAAMDAQTDEVQRLLAPLSDADLVTRKSKTPKGDDIALGTALLEYTLKWTVSYKMQLFLQAKHAGLSTLVSSNLWHGRDAAPKA